MMPETRPRAACRIEGAAAPPLAGRRAASRIEKAKQSKDANAYGYGPRGEQEFP